MLVTDATGGELVDTNLEPWDWQDYAVKRGFDVAFASLALLCLTPIILAIAAAVKLDSPSPVLYSQTQTAAFGETFEIYKFRSMVADVEAYDDLFLQREAIHPWLLDTRARDALNPHDIRIQGGHPALTHETIMGRREDQRKQQQTTTWYVHSYLHADDPAVLPLGEDVLESLQFGGKRNYGYGEVQLNDTQVVDLDELDYSRLKDAKMYLIELITPFVVETEYPDADDCSIPWWWAENRDDLRLREEKLLEQCEVFRLETVDHGQVMKYLGDHPVETAKNGLQRVGSHSRYGFGELRVKPLSEQYEEPECALE